MVRVLPMTAASSLHLASVAAVRSVSNASLRLPFSGPALPRASLVKLGSTSQQDGFLGRRGGRFVRNLSSLQASAAGNMAQTSVALKQEEALDWVKKDKRRLLHVVYRVGDLDKTIK